MMKSAVVRCWQEEREIQIGRTAGRTEIGGSSFQNPQCRRVRGGAVEQRGQRVVAGSS